MALTCVSLSAQASVVFSNVEMLYSFHRVLVADFEASRPPQSNFLSIASSSFLPVRGAALACSLRPPSRQPLTLHSQNLSKSSSANFITDLWLSPLQKTESVAETLIKLSDFLKMYTSYVSH